MLPQTQADLEASKTALSDAEQNHENLKDPCWANKDAAKARKEQLEGEIAALREAETMLEEFEGTFLLQESSTADAGKQTPTSASAAQIEKVVQLLQGIKSDVQKDLDSD